jgi:hypothetical protein
LPPEGLDQVRVRPIADDEELLLAARPREQDECLEILQRRPPEVPVLPDVLKISSWSFKVLRATASPSNSDCV